MEFHGIIPDRPRHYITRQHIMRYAFASTYVTGKKVLDIACGAGYGSSYLAGCGASMVVGMDISESALTYACSHYVRDNLHFLQGNAVQLPFESDEFDVVVSFETIEHVTQVEEYMKEMRRVLSPHGVFICSTPHVKYTRHPAYHVKEFFPEEFFRLLEDNFYHVERYAQFITVVTRIHDIIPITEYFNKLTTRIKHSLPFKSRLKTMRDRIIPSSSCQQTYEITSADTAAFRRERVTSLKEKGYSDLVRIMVAVCGKGGE
ncbi:MAG: class I SAM-dependent methyltransferase [Theionarchaea archaeon]|nr:class I SAM-dependent methyltransferase [Theionarchaea archaeon]MBU7001750.1 class I SAM-dependent methyltransferase [Theionarchaea archaeon]MBU7022103.1 class I SAM-dependent methyltransferase [Theionarchaea archaeon]MBU7036242.1 class I SAM-dependent methyltransferase [Theionarchaea archaeon]MBU7040861.1 class I SAM-dependent methyltransferase [Theionarchaea archaeon]